MRIGTAVAEGYELRECVGTFWPAEKSSVAGLELGKWGGDGDGAPQNGGCEAH